MKLVTSAPPVAKKTRTTRFMFSEEEDERLKELVKQYGTNNWIRISMNMKDRSVRQCKDRWTFYLSPDVNTDEFTLEEDQLLMDKVKEMGKAWTRISRQMTKRTPYAIKNRYQYITRQLERSGTDTSIEDIHSITKKHAVPRPRAQSQQQSPLQIEELKNKHIRKARFPNVDSDETHEIKLEEQPTAEEIEPSIAVSDEEIPFNNGENDYFYDFQPE